MKLTLWGTRGSLASAGPETVRYGGNTSCVEVRAADGSVLVLDAGTGMRRLGAALRGEGRRVDILLTHLHMDHIQGLGFFAPFFEPDREIHVWGPPSTTQALRERLTRYLSPPLFPVRIRELPCRLSLHDVPFEGFEIGPFRLNGALVCHPGPTVGYRVTADGVTLAYLCDHEPALGLGRVPVAPDWVSGFALAAGADVLIHDAQYSAAEYVDHVGWGHSALTHTLAFATLAGVRCLVTFHHDPGHDDETLTRLLDEARAGAAFPFEIVPGTEGLSMELGDSATLGARLADSRPAY
ncbi:MAG TPA: MBL fold metallo-hydrolase [Methylomirabilota bacterium]|nr:MBL fold metallo-hydrolase [Methylomirabilota bacterium]